MKKYTIIVLFTAWFVVSAIVLLAAGWDAVPDFLTPQDIKMKRDYDLVERWDNSIEDHANYMHQMEIYDYKFTKIDSVDHSLEEHIEKDFLEEFGIEVYCNYLKYKPVAEEKLRQEELAKEKRKDDLYKEFKAKGCK